MLSSKASMKRLIFVALLCILSQSGCATNPSRKYVVIDGGAHYGECIQAFHTTKLSDQYNWDIYAIEANEELCRRLELQLIKFDNITVINKAIWINEGTIDFYIQDAGDGHSSFEDHAVMRGYPEDTVRKVTVPSMDLSAWIQHNFSVDDYIILSLDIEGAENDVLEKMFVDGTMQYIDRAYISFHGDKIIDRIERNVALQRKIEALGIVYGYDSLDSIILKFKGFTDTMDKPTQDGEGTL